MRNNNEKSKWEMTMRKKKEKQMLAESGLYGAL